MTNDEARMSNPKAFSSFELRVSFVIRHLSFVISLATHHVLASFRPECVRQQLGDVTHLDIGVMSRYAVREHEQTKRAGYGHGAGAGGHGLFDPAPTDACSRRVIKPHSASPCAAASSLATLAGHLHQLLAALVKKCELD